ncbi:hypothetical protein [Listeria ilorinensis]|uniref:hypothetical protein n=1 Tax=Listeria ilorinensis TaxID=2867439 RepID=UPI001EF4626B|nr:hypothetical protein [Listeria ilorinensis]
MALSEAQKKAQKEYADRNRERRTYWSQRNAARSFIKNKATAEDLQELVELAEERKIKLLSDK